MQQRVLHKEWNQILWCASSVHYINVAAFGMQVMGTQHCTGCQLRGKQMFAQSKDWSPWPAHPCAAAKKSNTYKMH